MTIQSTCCGCHLVNDYGTSIVEGDGTDAPYAVRQTDPLFKRPVARIQRNANQSIPNNTDTALQFDIVNFDTHNMYDGLNNTRLTIPIDGLYLMGADISWAATTAVKEAAFRLNGVTELDRQSASDPLSGTIFWAQNLQYLWFFSQGDYVEVVAFQNSGAPINVGIPRNIFWMMYLGKKI